MLRLTGQLVGVTGQVLTGTYLGLPDIRFGGVTLRDAGGVAADAPIFEIWDLTTAPAMIVRLNSLWQMAQQKFCDDPPRGPGSNLPPQSGHLPFSWIMRLS